MPCEFEPRRSGALHGRPLEGRPLCRPMGSQIRAPTERGPPCSSAGGPTSVSADDQGDPLEGRPLCRPMTFTYNFFLIKKVNRALCRFAHFQDHIGGPVEEGGFADDGVG